MHIALIHFRFIHFGGLESRLKNYIHWLHQQGHKITVICTKYDPSIVLPEDVEILKIPRGWVPKFRKQVYFDRKLGKIMKSRHFDLSVSLMRTSAQDIVLCPGNHLGYLAALGRKKMNRSDRTQVQLDQDAFSTSGRILACSQMIADEVQHLYKIPAAKIKVLYPPLNTERFYPSSTPGEKAALRKTLNLPENAIVFVFSGLGHFRKGFPMLENIFAGLEGSNRYLVFMGGPEPKRKSPQIIYTGYQQDPRNIYVAADVLLHPALYEPYGQIVAEALACGIPALVSDKTGAREIIGHNQGEILPVNDYEVWKKKIMAFDPSGYDVSGWWEEHPELTLTHHMNVILGEK